MHHKTADHVAKDLNILIVDLQLQVVNACLDDATAELLGNVKLRNEVHVTEHLLFLALLHFLVVIEHHHGDRVVTLDVLHFLLAGALDLE